MGQIENYIADLQNVQDLYNLNWVLPYGSAYATANTQFKATLQSQADWDKMKPEAQGRFCSSCSKTVVDFSTMSVFSIVNYLENNKHQSVCGRFGEEQLAKTYLFAKPHPSVFSFDLFCFK